MKGLRMAAVLCINITIQNQPVVGCKYRRGSRNREQDKLRRSRFVLV
jgi:hypothetical protein